MGPVVVHPLSLRSSLSYLLPLGHMETWMTSRCGSAAREGKSLGYSGLTRWRAGYADFSRSLHQQWGMAFMQSKLPQLYGFQYIMIFGDGEWCRLIHFRKERKSLNDLHSVCLFTDLCMTFDNHKIQNSKFEVFTWFASSLNGYQMSSPSNTSSQVHLHVKY